jgi:FkbM family methyltransferase
MAIGTIYDFGMNNGDDVEYYLLKAARVVGVEANHALCEQVRRRFSAEIERGRLTVLNVALSEEESAEPISFYLHKTHHVLSQLPRPADHEMGDFEEVKVACRTPASIIREFGEPIYVKIDVEHSDHEVLRNIFEAGIFPPEISAESHSASVFACLVEAGYDSFNLVDGSTVPKVYSSTMVETEDGPVSFSFKAHSAGPFGEDIRGPWQDADSFLYTLASAELGWKDIHASKRILPDPPLSHRAVLKGQATALARKLAVAVRARLPMLREPG